MVGGAASSALSEKLLDPGGVVLLYGTTPPRTGTISVSPAITRETTEFERT